VPVIIEIATFKLAPRMTAGQLAPLDRTIDRNHMSKQPGLISRESVAAEDGDWLVVNYWKSVEDAEAARSVPGMAAWALGLPVGINMLFGGAAMIGMAQHARSATTTPTPETASRACEKLIEIKEKHQDDHTQLQHDRARSSVARRGVATSC